MWAGEAALSIRSVKPLQELGSMLEHSLFGCWFGLTWHVNNTTSLNMYIVLECSEGETVQWLGCRIVDSRKHTETDLQLPLQTWITRDRIAKCIRFCQVRSTVPITEVGINQTSEKWSRNHERNQWPWRGRQSRQSLVGPRREPRSKSRRAGRRAGSPSLR